MARSALLVTLIAGIFFAAPAAAMYKWVDDNGVTHYGETIPPEYANKSRVELDKHGRTIRKETILTPEQRRAQETANANKRKEEEAALEQQRRDKALVDTYSNVREIDLARDRNLQQVQAHIDSISSQIENVSDKLRGLRHEANLNVAAGKSIPRSLSEDIQETQERLAELKQGLEKAKANKSAVEARYEADKSRYKELTGKQQ